MSAPTPLTPRSLRDELAFLLDSTVDLAPEHYDRDTLLMRLECAFLVRHEAIQSTPAGPTPDSATAAHTIDAMYTARFNAEHQPDLTAGVAALLDRHTEKVKSALASDPGRLASKSHSGAAPPDTADAGHRSLGAPTLEHLIRKYGDFRAAKALHNSDNNQMEAEAYLAGALEVVESLRRERDEALAGRETAEAYAVALADAYAERRWRESAERAEAALRGWKALWPDLAQLLDGWHQDGTAWTPWDESVRKRLTEAGIAGDAALTARDSAPAPPTPGGTDG